MLKGALLTGIKFYRFERHHDTDRLQALRRALARAKLYSHRYGAGDRPAGYPTTGYALYNLPLLVSYSRSGTNWIRYVIETISRRPTPGQTRVHKGQDYVIDRAHCGFPEMNFHPRVILLIRDYRECLIRHHQRSWHPEDEVSAFLENKEIDQSPTWYINNIIAFDNFSGPKTVIYYENEILDNPSASAAKAAQFLSIGSNRLRSFTDNIQQHVRRSIGLYKGGGHSSTTPEKKDPMHHAKKHLTPEQIRAFDEYYSTRYPMIFSKYLDRYDTRE